MRFVPLPLILLAKEMDPGPPKVRHSTMRLLDFFDGDVRDSYPPIYPSGRWPR